MRGVQTYSLHRGIGAHWRELMRALAAVDSENTYVLLYAKGFPASDDEVDYPPNFERLHITVPFFRRKRSLFYLWLFDGARVEGIFHRRGVDIALLTTFAEVWFPGKPFRAFPTVVWVYDLIPFVFPRQYFDEARYGRLKRFLMHRKLRYTACASRIITSSRAVKDDWVRFTGYPPSRVDVIPLGVGRGFFAADGLAAEALRKKLALPERFILYVGGIDPRKNLIRALEAYAKARRKADVPEIVIAGSVNKSHPDFVSLTEKISELGLEGRVRFLGFVDDSDLPALYRAAQFLLFPTLYEGFGLPALEAMASGCPVLTSNCSALPEVVGDAALLVDPYDVDAIADAIAALAENESLRRRLSRAGRLRAQGFTWEDAARRLVETLRKALEVGDG